MSHYLTQFNQTNMQVPWLQQLQESSLQRFLATGFPNRHSEHWKYTDLSLLDKMDFTFPTESANVNFENTDSLTDCYRLVFVDGFLNKALSNFADLDTSINMLPFADAAKTMPELMQDFLQRDLSSPPLVDLNTAFINDGMVLQLLPHAILSKPLHLLFLTTPSSSPKLYATRNILVLSKHSQATVLEEHRSVEDTVYLKNSVMQIEMAENATLHYYKIQNEGCNAFHYAVTEVHQKRDSQFFSHSFSVGAKLARDDLNVALLEAGSYCQLDGLYLADAQQHVDHHTRVDHFSEHGTSKEYYKGILSGAASGVFNGKIVVHPGAVKTASEQSNKNLLLSKKAEVNTKPELEIYADDVKCTHGATVGQIDEEALFYLRARGLDEIVARNILVQAFAMDVVGRIRDDVIAEYIAKIVDEKILGLRY